MNINPKLFYKWQKEAQTPVAAALGAGLDPATAAELRQLRAVLAQQPTLPGTTPGLVMHSDRGGQYGGNAYRALLHRHEALRSHSRRGECYDNALPGTTQAESLWSRLKTEELERPEWPVFADLADAQASVADYFDYHNHERLHSSIDYQLPYRIHQQILRPTALNCPA